MIVPDQMSCAAALALFDSLPPVAVGEMFGDWSGRGIATGHPLDHLLAVSGWMGKRFDDADTVHPLIHHSVVGPVGINPGLLPLRLAMRLNVHHWPLARQAFYLLAPLLCSRAPRARLRMVAWAGVSSAAMVYDQKPIIDHFRRVDGQRVIGLMDFRGDPAPFFFLLERPVNPVPDP